MTFKSLYRTFAISLFSVLAFGITNAMAISAIPLKDTPTAMVNYKQSSMIVSRDEGRTVVTIIPNYSYDGEKIAFLIPVSNLVSETQIRVGDIKASQKLLDYTSPRILPYKDLDSCKVKDDKTEKKLLEQDVVYKLWDKRKAVASVDDVKVEVISSEDLERRDLETIIKDRSFVLDKAYIPLIEEYNAGSNQFVWVEYTQSADDQRVMPSIQIAYERDTFTLPIALSSQATTVAQDITLLFVTRHGMVLPETMAVKKIANDKVLPQFALDQFDDVYSKIFDKALIEDNFKSVFLEYSGDINWCPNCQLTNKLAVNELRSLGVWWLDKEKKTAGGKKPKAKSDISDVYITRYRLKHTSKTIEGGVSFKVEQDKSRYNVYYNARKPNLEKPKCEKGRLYKAKLQERFEEELLTYTALTGEVEKDVKALMESTGQKFDIPLTEDEVKWWENMWDIQSGN